MCIRDSSYAVPALCEAVSNNIDTHLHTAGKSNLVFKPSFKVHEYRIDFMLKSILSSQKFKSGLKKLTNDALRKGIFGAPTFLINKKIFWGQDRLSYAVEEAKK